MSKIDTRKLVLWVANGAIALGLIVSYTVNVWIGIISTAVVLITLGSITIWRGINER